MMIWCPGTVGGGGGGRRSRQSKIYDACGNQLLKGYSGKKKPPAIVEPSPRTGNGHVDVKNDNAQSSGDVLAPLGPPRPKSILKKRDSSLVVPNRRSLVKTHSLEMEDAYAVPAKRVTKEQLLEGTKTALPPKPAKTNRPKSALKAQTPPTPVRASRSITKPNSVGGNKSADSGQMSSLSSNAASERRQARRDREVVLTPVIVGDKLNNNNNSNNNLTADGRPKSFMKKLFLMQ